MKNQKPFIGIPVNAEWIHQLSGLNRARVKSWGTRGGIAILDQGLFSGSNFLLNVLLARWLSTDEYGAFSVVFAIYLFLTSFHNALLLEPMSIIGPAKYNENLPEYLAGQIRLHFAITVPMGMLMAGTGWVLISIRYGDIWLSQSMIGAGLALPFMLLLWVVRRMFYVLQNPPGAMTTSLLYAILLIAGLWGAKQNSYVSSPNAFGLMGLASLVASLLILWRLNRYMGTRRWNLPLGNILGAHWGYGKWLVGTAILAGVNAQAQTLLTAGLISLDAAGTLRALQNFVLPMSQAITAIATLVMPVLAFDFGRRRLGSLRRKGIFTTLALTVTTLAYGLVIWMSAPGLESFLYGGKYANFIWLIPILNLVPLFTAIGTGYSIIVRAIQKPQLYLITYLITMPVGLVSSVVLIRFYGITGAAISDALTTLVAAIIAIYLYRIWFPKSNEKSKAESTGSDK